MQYIFSRFVKHSFSRLSRQVLEFVLKFDECKMGTPAVQNDFSYYRRSVQRSRYNIHYPLFIHNYLNVHFNCCRGSATARVLVSRSVSEDNDAAEAANLPTYETNAMSLFFAHATPMLNALSLVVTKHVKVI